MASDVNKLEPARKGQRPYHHGNLRTALLEAAEVAIREHGVAELRLRDLARRVGVSHGAPANHFRDRNALLVALAVQGFDKLREAQAEVLAQQHDSPLDALHAIGVAYVRFSVEHPAHFEVMFQRELLMDPKLLQAAGRTFEQLMGVIGDVQGNGEGAPRGDVPLGALGAWALVHGLANLHAMGLLPSAICNDVPKLAAEVLAAMTRIVEGQAGSKG